jgi:hypothetical protein
MFDIPVEAWLGIIFAWTISMFFWCIFVTPKLDFYAIIAFWALFVTIASKLNKEKNSRILTFLGFLPVSLYLAIFPYLEYVQTTAKANIQLPIWANIQLVLILFIPIFLLSLIIGYLCSIGLIEILKEWDANFFITFIVVSISTFIGLISAGILAFLVRKFL